MKTVLLQHLHVQDADRQQFAKYRTRMYTLEGINDFMQSVVDQSDCALYFPISAYIKHKNRVYSAYITEPIKIITK